MNVFEILAVDEAKKKKKRKKSKAALWGPGPYGMYGFDAGFSGGDGGAVGEASYTGNIGAMEVFAFMKKATDTEKAMLKTLIAKQEFKLAWYLIQKVTGIKLQGKEFEMMEDWKSAIAGFATALGMSGAPAMPNPNPQPAAVVQNPGASGKIMTQYIVKPGDTVYSLAKANGTTPQEIQKLNKLDKNFSIDVGQKLILPASGNAKNTVTKKANAVAPAEFNVHERFLYKIGKSAGMDDNELAQFLAHCAHETQDFLYMKEFGGSLDFRKYDPKFSPKKAKALGNTKVGDGARYKGRGYIQLTGRYNYRMAGRALGLPLEKHPEMVEKPEIAAKVALWYWKTRVRPDVSNWKNTTQVTKPINPGLRGLEDRHENFKDYVKIIASR